MDLEQLKALLEQKSQEFKQGNETLATQVKEFGAESKEAKELAQKNDETLTEMKELFEKLDAKLVEVEKEHKRFSAQSGIEKKTLGQLFTEQEIKLEHTRRFERKDITSGTDSAGALTNTMRVPEVRRGPDRNQFIRDLLPNVPTSDGSIDFMRELEFDNQAGPQNGELANKNQSDLTFERVTVPVRDIAHYVITSRQVLSDAPRLQSYIDNRLAYGLRLQSDEQMLYGSGTGSDLTGLMVDANIDSVPAPAVGATQDLGQAKIEHIRAAITQLQITDYRPTGVIINPLDWEDMETSKDADGRYLLMPFPAAGGEERLWRVPVVVTNAINAGEFLIGDWNMGATLYVREDISVRVSESHANLFVQNGVAILAEERMALAIELPGAFKKGTFATAAE